MARLLQKFFVLTTFVIFGLDTTYCEIITSTETGEMKTGNCSCGGFSSAEPEAGAEPMISQMPGLVVKCDADGNSNCKNLCLALATATQAKGPEVVCARLRTAHELKLSAFSKVCDDPWEYTGMSAEVPLCCSDSAVQPCPSTL